MSETEQWWLVHWTGGDQGYVPMSESELVQQLDDEAEWLVDACEQEILGGDHWDNPEREQENLAIRDREISSLSGDLGVQLSKAIRDGGGTIKVNPWYAVNQRSTYRIDIQPKPYDEGASA